MKKKIILIFLFIATIVIGQKLEIKFEIEKTEYLQYEPISILLTIKNVGSNKVTIRSITSFSRSIKANIVNKNGEVVKPFEESFAIVHGGAVYDLLDGEEIFARLNLLNYGNCYSKINRTSNYFEPGEYTIEIKYKHYSIITSKEKVFISNKKKITIYEPTKEDVEGIISDLKELSVAKKEKKVINALRIIDNYPKHPLVQQAYLYLDPGDIKYYDFDRTQYIKDFCIKFPHSFRAQAYASMFIENDLKFVEKISGTVLYEKALKVQSNKKKMRKMMERNPSNERILREIKRREIEKKERTK